MAKLYLLLFSFVMLLSSCEAIGTIFKAGMIWAFFLVALVVVIIIWVVSKSRK